MKPIRGRGFGTRFVLCHSKWLVRRLDCICSRIRSVLDQTPQFDYHSGFGCGWKSSVFSAVMLSATALQRRIISKCSTWGQPLFLLCHVCSMHKAMRSKVFCLLLSVRGGGTNLLICLDLFCSRMMLRGMLALPHNYLHPQTLRFWVITNYVMLSSL